jgi:hypothetical protein
MDDVPVRRRRLTGGSAGLEPFIDRGDPVLRRAAIGGNALDVGLALEEFADGRGVADGDGVADEQDARQAGLLGNGRKGIGIS